jgi:hypothetical protein
VRRRRITLEDGRYLLFDTFGDEPEPKAGVRGNENGAKPEMIATGETGGADGTGGEGGGA